MPNWVGTSNLDRVIHRFADGNVSQGGGDIIRRNGLHQSRWDANRLSFRRPLGDTAHELEELRSTHDRVRNQRSLD